MTKSVNDKLDVAISELEQSVKTLQEKKGRPSNKVISEKPLPKAETDISKAGISNKTPIEKIYKSLNLGNLTLLIRNKSKQVNQEWIVTNDLVCIFQFNANSKYSNSVTKEYLRGSQVIELIEFLDKAKKLGYVKKLITQEQEYLKNQKKKI